MRPYRIRFRQLAWLLSGLLAVLRVRSEPQWIRLTTPHFDVVSEASEEKSKEVLLRFEQLRLAMTNGFFPGRINPLPTRILMLKGSDQVDRLIHGDAKGSLKADGGYHGGPSDNFILVDIENDVRLGYRISQHEYVHLLTRDSSDSWPMWMVEGFASCFETAEIQKNWIRFGEPIRYAMDRIRGGRGFTHKELFAVQSSQQLIRMPKSKAEYYYPQSWLLMHFLVFGLSAQEEERLGRFFAAVELGSSSEEAFEKVFGWTGEELWERIETHHHQGRFRFRRLEKQGGTVDIRIRKESSSTAAAWAALFQIDIGRREEAEMPLRIAVEAGGGVWTEMALGEAALRRRDREAAVVHLRKAVALEPDLVQARFRLARALVGGGAGEVHEAGSLLRRTLKQHANFGTYWSLLGTVEREGKGGLQASLDAFTQALDLNPLDHDSRMLAALVLRDAGEKAHAKSNLQRVIRLSKDPILLAAAQSALKELEEKN